MEGIWRRLVHGVQRLQQQPYWEDFAGPGWADRIMGLALSDRFHAKQGRTIVRWTLRSGERSLVVYLKRHYRLPRWQGLLATVWPGQGGSPALQEARHLEWARLQGLPVPAVVAAGFRAILVAVAAKPDDLAVWGAVRFAPVLTSHSPWAEHKLGAYYQQNRRRSC